MYNKNRECTCTTKKLSYFNFLGSMIYYLLFNNIITHLLETLHLLSNFDTPCTTQSGSSTID